MAKNIERKFGLMIEVDKDIPKARYVSLQKEISGALTTAQLDPKKVQVYIHHLSIRAADNHFKAGPISKRMDRLDVNLTIGESARRDRQIRFLNHELGVVFQVEPKLNSRDYRIQYSLSGHYCETHTEFDDYVALLVEPSCPEKHKTLTMSITAYATSEFRQRLVNNATGTANTKIVFSLSQDIQLTF